MTTILHNIYKKISNKATDIFIEIKLIKTTIFSNIWKLLSSFPEGMLKVVRPFNFQLLEYILKLTQLHMQMMFGDKDNF